MIEESVIREVIERTDIVRLIGEYVQLKRRGKTMVGLCPFHHEKTPSFHVNGELGRFKCFGCGAGGNAANFLMKLENRSFPEAIELLAERLGIRIEHKSRENDSFRQQARDREKAFYEVLLAAQAYFASELKQPEGEGCLAYAHRRGISDEMISSFGLGFAPESWDGIVDEMRRRKQPLEDAKTLGLVASRESGGYYARFRNRLMFPVYNVRGNVIAFSGRVLNNAEPAKYINSPESQVYTKGEHLFGLYQAKMHITREHCAILVEGNVDVVMMHSFGFCHTVASLGTALTSKQAELLFRNTKKVYLMYDGDEAGRKAMCRALPVLLGYDFEGLYAVELPKDDDPDSFLRTYGADGMNELIQKAQSLGIWCVQKKCQDILKLPPELRKSAFGELSDLLHGFNDSLTQHHYLEEAARFLGQDTKRLATELGMNLDIAPQQPQSVKGSDVETVKFNRLEWTVVAMLLASSQRYEAFMRQQGLDLITDPALHALMVEYSDVKDKSSRADILMTLSERSNQLYERIVCTEIDVPEDELDKWFEGAVASLIRAWAARERQLLGHEIAEAVKRQAEDEISALLQKDMDLLGLMMQTEKDRQYCWQRE